MEDWHVGLVVSISIHALRKESDVPNRLASRGR